MHIPSQEDRLSASQKPYSRPAATDIRVRDPPRMDFRVFSEEMTPSKPSVSPKHSPKTLFFPYSGPSGAALLLDLFSFFQVCFVFVVLLFSVGLSRCQGHVVLTTPALRELQSQQQVPPHGPFSRLVTLLSGVRLTATREAFCRFPRDKPS